MNILFISFFFLLVWYEKEQIKEWQRRQNNEFFNVTSFCFPCIASFFPTDAIVFKTELKLKIVETVPEDDESVYNFSLKCVKDSKSRYGDKDIPYKKNYHDTIKTKSTISVSQREKWWEKQFWNTESHISHMNLYWSR